MTIDFEPSDLQRSLRDAVTKVCRHFDDAYWLQCDPTENMPTNSTENSIRGLARCLHPEAYGGSGLGLTEAAILMKAISASVAGFSGRLCGSHEHFGLDPVVVYGGENKAPNVAARCRGKEKACFAVTEPNAVLKQRSCGRVRTSRRSLCDTSLEDSISTAQMADKMLILVRTAPLEVRKKPTDGFSLFYTALDRRFVEVRRIEKIGRKAVNSNCCSLMNLRFRSRIDWRGGLRIRIYFFTRSCGKDPDRGRSGGPWPRRAQARNGLRERARRIRSPNRPKSSNPTPVGGNLDRTGSSQSHGI